MCLKYAYRSTVEVQDDSDYETDSHLDVANIFAEAAAMREKTTEKDELASLPLGGRSLIWRKDYLEMISSSTGHSNGCHFTAHKWPTLSPTCSSMVVLIFKLNHWYKFVPPASYQAKEGPHSQDYQHKKRGLPSRESMLPIFYMIIAHWFWFRIRVAATGASLILTDDSNSSDI